MKSLASKVKSLALASRPQVLENWPVLGSRTAVFFELLKFCGVPEKFFGKRHFFGDHLKKFCEDLFFGEHLRLCPWPWPRAFLFLASRVHVLGKAVLGLGFFCVLGLEPCVLDSTSGFYGRQKELLSITALATHRSFTGFAGKLPSSCCILFIENAFVAFCENF